MTKRPRYRLLAHLAFLATGLLVPLLAIAPLVSPRTEAAEQVTQAATTPIYLPLVSKAPAVPPGTALPPELLGKPMAVDGNAPAYVEGTIYNSTKELAVWIPPNRQVVRGILFMNGTASRPSPGDLDWRIGVAQQRMLAMRQLASLWGFGLVTGTFWGQKDEVQRLNAAIQELATTTGHRELVHAPMVIVGGSRFGGLCRDQAAKAFSGRIIACVIEVFWPSATTTSNIGIPTMVIAGERDHGQEIIDSVRSIRREGSLISAVMLWGIGHNCDRCKDVTWPYLDQVIRHRVPADADPRNGPVALRPYVEDQGYLGDFETWASIASYQTYSKDKRTAAWLPNHYSAAIWRNFTVKTPSVRITEPTSPYQWANGFTQKPSSRRASEPITLVAEIKAPVSGELSFYDGDVFLGKGTVSADGKKVTLANVQLAPGMHSIVVMNGSVPVSWPAGIILL